MGLLQVSCSNFDSMFKMGTEDVYDKITSDTCSCVLKMNS